MNTPHPVNGLTSHYAEGATRTPPSDYVAKVLERFADQERVTIATGATCAYLSDERGLREFLVADEIASALRKAGHTVVFFLIDDSLDPLNIRQLRVAVNKDEELIERYQHWCGKPISHLPDPWGCHESYADHFEDALLNRLHYLNCHPTLVRTAKLYERGVYAPYIRRVLEHHNEVKRFLAERFASYNPEKLFWAICPHCGYIDETSIERTEGQTANVSCSRCERMSIIPFDEIKGKLNWKLDCAVRWKHLEIDAEPFSKSYLEPQTGSFAVAQALSIEFFDAQRSVFPLHYGTVKMENKFGLKLLDSLPPETLRTLLVEHPQSDIKLTHDLVVTTASRHEVLPDVSYLDFVKQLLPTWLLTQDSLSWEERNLVKHGIAFRQHFLRDDARFQLPTRELLQGEQAAVLGRLHSLLLQVVQLRQGSNKLSWAEFEALTQSFIAALGPQKKAILHRLRLIVGQEHGLPVTRILFFLPLEYLQTIEYMLELYCSSTANGLVTNGPAICNPNGCHRKRPIKMVA